MKKKKILAITGIRSEYDILYPVLKSIEESQDFDLDLVVSSAHLSDWHGNTIKKIEEDGFNIVDKLDCLLMTNRSTQRAKGVGILTYSLSQTVERVNPDFLFVVGDREESIASAIVGNYMNIITAHLGGGDPVFGNADDPIRMAVSKLAHVHFTTAREYSDNLRNLSEEEFRIFFCGNPALSNIRHTSVKSLKEISSFLSFDITDGNYLVLVKHPLSSEEGDAYFQMETTLKALEEFCRKYDFKVIASYPNTDPGSYDILRAIRNFEDKPFIRFYPNIPREYFINIMRNTKALVGNSSMGILEAPFYKLPVVNIGSRQQGRLNAGNLKFAGYNQSQIIELIEEACFDIEYKKLIQGLDCPYGDGSAPEIILNSLSQIDTKDKKWTTKTSLC